MQAIILIESVITMIYIHGMCRKSSCMHISRNWIISAQNAHMLRKHTVVMLVNS